MVRGVVICKDTHMQPFDLDDDDDDAVAPPEGVRLRNPDDTDGIRDDIEQGVMKAMQHYVHGYEYGGTRLELSNMAYTDRPRYSLAEQREALLKDATLARRLRGTVSLVDVETNKPLEVRKNVTLARVPYLTQRGTMIHNGSEYAPVSQSRLLPGAYTRKRNNGELETHFNTRPGTGSAMRVSLDPSTGQYRLRVGTSNVHAYSVFKDLGVSDEELTKRWGPEVLEANRAGYDARAVDRVYLKAIPKWQRDPGLSKAEKAAAVAAAFDRAQVARTVLHDNLPNLFSREKAASWRLKGHTMEKLANPTARTTHELVFGPSGAGKTTKALQLAAETGLPVLNIDDDPEWRNFVRANDYNRDPEGKLIHTIDGTPQNEAWKALMLKLSEKALAKKNPHIIEGTHLMMLNPAELRGHNLHLVNPPLETVKSQRIERSKLSRKELGRPDLTEADILIRERLAEDLYNAAQPAAKVWASVKSGERAIPPVTVEEPVRPLSLAEATKAILLKQAATTPATLKPTAAPQAHHRYLADDDEHEEYASIGIDGLLASTEKLLAVNRGLERPDHRDSASNDRVYTVDRLMAERIKLDHGKTLRGLMGRLSRRKNLSALGPAAFDAYTVDYLKGNPTASAIEEINPMSIAEQRRRITKMGPGGIGDPNAITVAMQSVDASQFGFISPLEGPESEKAGIDVRLAYGARVGSDGRIYQLVRNVRTGKKEWVSPSSLKGKTIRLPD